MLDYTKLRGFVEVARAGSFSRAARALRVSQPTLSVQIARLEKDLGIKLLIRESHGVVPTEAGYRLLRRSEDLFAHIEEVEQSLHGADEELCGGLRVGAAESLSTYVLPEVLAYFMRRYPGIKLTMHGEYTHELIRMLQKNELDLAFFPYAATPPVEFTTMLEEDPLLLVCGPGHAFWKRRFVRPKDLSNEVFIRLEGGSSTTELVDTLLSRHQLKPVSVVYCKNIAIMVEMVKHNVGLAFVPAMATRRGIENGQLHAVQFEPEHLHRNLWAAWRSTAPAPARNAFINSVRRALRLRKNDTDK